MPKNYYMEMKKITALVQIFKRMLLTTMDLNVLPFQNKNRINKNPLSRFILVQQISVFVHCVVHIWEIEMSANDQENYKGVVKSWQQIDHKW